MATAVGKAAELAEPGQAVPVPSTGIRWRREQRQQQPQREKELQLKKEEEQERLKADSAVRTPWGWGEVGWGVKGGYPIRCSLLIFNSTFAFSHAPT